MGGYIEGPEGIGGWLVFFMLALGVVSPATALFQMLGLYADPSVPAAFGRLWTLLQVVEWSLFAVSAAACWYLVWRLIYVRTWKTVRTVIAGIWLISVVSLAAEFVVVSLAAGLPVFALLAESGFETIRPIIFCTIWTGYFVTSKRVANTYRRDPEGEALADVFS
jgi:hypothetical protein